MTSPPDTKTVRVSRQTHAALHDLANRLSGRAGTADEAIQYLLGMSAVRVPVTDTQRARWAEYAKASGISLAQWVTLRVEAAIQYGNDPGTMHIVLDHVRALAAHAGIKVRRTAPRNPEPWPEPESRD